MRASVLTCGLLSVLLVVFVGCGKGSPAAADAGAPPGAIIDASKFRPAFEGAPAEAQTQVNKIMLDIGASDYVGALSGLESLTNVAGLTEPQKAAAANLSQQLQLKLASIPPPTQ